MTTLVRAAGVLAGFAAALAAGLYAYALSDGAPDFASGLFPASRFEVSCERTPEAACTFEDARRAAANAPLGAGALSLKLAAQYEAGDAAGLTELARLVLSQDARSELARIVLAEDALAEGDREAFLRLYLPLFQTDRRQAGVYAEVLAAVSGDPDLFQLIERQVQETQPYWGGQYLAALAGAAQVPLAEMMSLYAEFPAAQPSLLGKLTGSGRWPGAYVVFIELLSSGALKRETGLPALSVPYNPNLLEIKAPPPFNWRLQGQGAEWLDGGGVYAFFQGRRGETFLVQSFPLSPGSWRLSANMSGDVSETGGWFRWQLRCASGTGVLASFDVQKLTAAPATYDFEFERPAEACELLTLSLIGVPGTFPQPARVELRSVSLELIPTGEAAQ